MTAVLRARHRRVLVVVTVLLGLLGAGAGQVAQADTSTKVLLLLDVSGSMNSKIDGGGTKFEAAKKALKQVAAALPAGTQVGLRVYGSTISEPQEKNPKACTDTQLVLPIGPLDQARMTKAVDSFTAKGETPIAYSLEQSVKDLGTSGKRVLILISDGKETCSGDPCPTARKLAESGVDLQFNAVGLAVDPTARKQLQCIADAGDGSYYDASQATELEQAVRKLTQRALRPFQLTGTPVTGTEDEAGAPPLAPGQYLDRYEATKTPRYYRIDRTPGSAVTASITSIVNPFKGPNAENWQLELTTVDGGRCDLSLVQAQTFNAATVLSGGVRSTKPGAAGGDACASGPLLLAVSRSAISTTVRPTPVEITVAEEPPITNLASLPAGVEGYTGSSKTVPAVGTAKPALGGTSFSNAPEIGAGSWTDSVTVGETVLYLVKLQTGQKVRVTLDAPAPKTKAPLSGAEAVSPVLALYGPSRVPLARQSGVVTFFSSARLSAASPEVRVRNREAAPSGYVDPVGGSSVAGDYYVAVQLNQTQQNLAGRVLPVQLDVAIDGQPSGQPVYAVASPTPVATPSSDPTAAATPTTGPSTTVGGFPVVPVVLAAVVLLGAVVAALVLVRRRRRPG